MAEETIPATDETGATSAITAPEASDPNVDAARVALEELSEELAPITGYLVKIYETIVLPTLSINGLIELGVIALAGLLALLIAKVLRSGLSRSWPERENRFATRARVLVFRLIPPIIWLVLLWTSSSVLSGLGYNRELVRIAASLLNAWIVIRIITSAVSDPFWSNTIATIAWAAAALNILRLLDPTIELLDKAAFSIGDTRFSLYTGIKGAILTVVLLWLASQATRFVQIRVQRSKTLTPSVQTLIGQTVRIGLLFAAVTMALNAVGIDLTALAVFSGAVGVGIGFGLQSIFSNLVAGIILLFERSIKVGDFVDLDNGLTGEVREINIRSTRITTNDNIDILVPNAEFINNRVTNWTLRDAHRRIRIPFGVAYGTDKELVRKVVLEAAAKLPHALGGPQERPNQVWLTAFGESSLDFELVIWLHPDAVKRPGAVSADYNWAIETALTANNIEIPFPQRDLHIRSGKLPILMTREGKEPKDPSQD